MIVTEKAEMLYCLHSNYPQDGSQRTCAGFCNNKTMAKTYAQKFYNSKKWMNFRQMYLSEHPYCERCKQAGLIVPAEHVHHIIYITPENISNPYITLNAENVEALCQACHNREHHGNADLDDELMFDENGNIRKREEGA